MNKYCEWENSSNVCKEEAECQSCLDYGMYCYKRVDADGVYYTCEEEQ